MSSIEKREKGKKYSELNINIEEKSSDFEFEELNDEIDKVLNEQKLFIEERRDL